MFIETILFFVVSARWLLLNDRHPPKNLHTNIFNNSKYAMIEFDKL